MIESAEETTIKNAIKSMYDTSNLTKNECIHYINNKLNLCNGMMKKSMLIEICDFIIENNALAKLNNKKFTNSVILKLYELVMMDLSIKNIIYHDVFQLMKWKLETYSYSYSYSSNVWVDLLDDF